MFEKKQHVSEFRCKLNETNKLAEMAKLKTFLVSEVGRLLKPRERPVATAMFICKSSERWTPSLTTCPHGRTSFSLTPLRLKGPSQKLALTRRTNLHYEPTWTNLPLSSMTATVLRTRLQESVSSSTIAMTRPLPDPSQGTANLELLVRLEHLVLLDSVFQLS